MSKMDQNLDSGARSLAIMNQIVPKMWSKPDKKHQIAPYHEGTLKDHRTSNREGSSKLKQVTSLQVLAWVYQMIHSSLREICWNFTAVTLDIHWPLLKAWNLDPNNLDTGIPKDVSWSSKKRRCRNGGEKRWKRFKFHGTSEWNHWFFWEIIDIFWEIIEHFVKLLKSCEIIEIFGNIL